MRPFLLVVSLGFAAALGCSGRTDPASSEKSKGNSAESDQTDEYGPWVHYDDPTFTALFPTRDEPAGRDKVIERAVKSYARGMTCWVIVNQTLPGTEDFERNPDKALALSRGYVKKPSIDGKYTVLQKTAPGSGGIIEAARQVYAHKRWYTVVASGMGVKTGDEAQVVKFLDSFRPKE